MSRSSSRWMYWLFGVVIGIILIVKGLTILADYYWYEAMRQVPVFTTILGTKIVLGFALGVPFFLWLWWHGRLARRGLPEGVVLVGRRLLSDEERDQVDRYLDRILLVFALIGGLMVGVVASSHWLDWIHFRNAVPFDYKDPIFGLNAAFYVFKLNFYLYIWRVVFYAFAVAFVLAVLVYFYQEAIRVVGNTVHAMPHARTHSLLLLGGALLVKAVGYRLDQFNLLYSTQGEVFYGASYADLHGRLPILWALVGLSVVAAIACFISVRGRRFLWPGTALAVVAVVSVLGGASYPYLLQKLVVNPNQLAMETPYITDNITATRKAFKLDHVDSADFHLQNDLNWNIVRRNWPTIENLRLWDHRPLEQTFQQTQALRAYYNFPDVDVDRYWVSGRYREVMLSARQLDYSQIQSPAWVKTYMQYTHGYGLCMTPVTTAGPEGLPDYWISDIPPVATKPSLKVTRPGLYYMASLHPRLIELLSRPEQVPQSAPAGPQAPTGPGQVGQQQPAGTRSETARARPSTEGVESPYAIVHTKVPELDYPRMGPGATGGDDNETTHYSGSGGVPIDSFLRRLAFAAKFTDIQILLTGQIDKGSRIIVNRYVPERFMALAPWLMYDPDPYLVLVNGQLKWMCDAYTISNRFPYSQPFMNLMNYMRNSVKIVCDAYNGIPTYYVYDQSDPMIQCYEKAFPTLFKPKSAMPKDLQAHVRYPELFFLAQAETYAAYHQDTATFYQAEDCWSIPLEIYSQGQRLVEPYYVIMKLPGHKKEEFLMMLPMTLKGREERNMVAWMAARCDAPNYGKLVVFRFPKNALAYGPMQFEYRINQNSEISQLFTLWGQLGSRIIRGNTLAIPIEHSILYVEPVFLVSTATGGDSSGQGGSGLPELKRVILSVGDKLAIGRTVDDALTKLLGQPGAAGLPTTEAAAPGAPSKPPTAIAPSSALRQLLDQALKLDSEAIQLLKQGDLAGYQSKHEEESKVLRQMQQMTK